MMLKAVKLVRKERTSRERRIEGHLALKHPQKKQVIVLKNSIKFSRRELNHARVRWEPPEDSRSSKRVLKTMKALGNKPLVL